MADETTTGGAVWKQVAPVAQPAGEGVSLVLRRAAVDAQALHEASAGPAWVIERQIGKAFRTVPRLAVSPDGDWLLAMQENGYGWRAGLRSGECPQGLRVPPKVSAIAIGAGGETIGVGCGEGVIQLYAGRRVEKSFRLSATKYEWLGTATAGSRVRYRRVTALHQLDDGPRLLAAYGEERVLGWACTDGGLAEWYEVPEGSGAGLNALWAAEGGRSVMAGDFLGRLHSWDRVSSAHASAAQRHAWPVLQITGARSGDAVLSLGGDGTVCYTSLSAAIRERTWQPGLRATAASLLNAGQLAAIGSSTGEITIWDIQSWSVTARWHAHLGGVAGLHSAGSRLVSTGADGRVLLWAGS